MSRTEFTEILEICIRRIEAGRTIDEAIADYPSEKEDLRALLQLALDARPQGRAMNVPSSAQVNSRKRFLAQAQQMQQRPRPASLWSLLNFLRVNAGQIAFGLAAVALLFVALGSVQALPGDGLYPVKLAAEQAEVSLAGSSAERVTLESSYDYRRAEEVVQMILLKRTGRVRFGGYLNQTGTGSLDVVSIPLVINQQLDQQARGFINAYVEITGNLGADGKVMVDTLEPRLETLVGTIERLDAGEWLVGEKLVKITAASQISGSPQVGSRVTLQTAQLRDSQQVLAVSGEVAVETPSATPQPSQPQEKTIATPLPAAVTNTPTNTSESQPVEITQEPADDHEDKPDEKTVEPEDNSGSGSEPDPTADDSSTKESDDHSGSGSGSDD
jgi:anti-sigma-K factor RskA